MRGSDNQLQLEDEICLKGKKKLACKRITGFQVSAPCLLFASRPKETTRLLFSRSISVCVLYRLTFFFGKASHIDLHVGLFFSLQFSPSDPTKVLVTSADSQVRVLCGADVLLKFKGEH